MDWIKECTYIMASHCTFDYVVYFHAHLREHRPLLFECFSLVALLLDGSNGGFELFRHLLLKGRQFLDEMLEQNFAKPLS